MSTSILLCSLSTLLPGQIPDALDHLRSGDVVPQVGLLLDRSGSMAFGHEATDCSWFANQHNGGSTTLNMNQQMKAALVGCRSATDGLLEQWAARVNFSIYEFGTGASLRTPFGSSLEALKSGAMAVPASGWTHMSVGLREMGNYFRTHFNDTNSKSCRPNYIVLLSDGDPNGVSATFNYECKPPVESRTVSATQPWRGSDYLFKHEDILCSVTGDQSIRTYSIGFGKPGDFNPEVLQSIATHGGGDYFHASDAQELGAAFRNIAGAIAAKSAVFFAPLAIQADSMFAENYAYVASFRPIEGGPWRGTVKKHCVVPPSLPDGRYDLRVTSCLFSATADGQELLTNPDAAYLWTGARSLSADVGGAGEVILAKLGSTPGGPPVAPFYTRRNLLTWRPGEVGYVPVRPDTWGHDDAWTNGCERDRLINFLHGYTYDADCTTGAPIAVASWPLGDPVNFAPVLLRYGACQEPNGTPRPGACYLVMATNHGVIHFLDAATGDETSALIPGDLWRPTGVGGSMIRELMDQPNSRFTHRYFVDGEPRLYHEDLDGDGNIDPQEPAYLIFGLGRGGRAYYRLPVSRLDGGLLSTTHNPITPLRATAESSFEDLQETWAAPWLGLGRFEGAVRKVAIFPSGHPTPQESAATAPAPAPAPPPGAAPPAPVDLTKAKTINCEGRDHFADFNGLGMNRWCHDTWFGGCRPPGKACYDGAGVPLDVASKPLTFNDGVRKAGAIRVLFQNFDIHSGDVLRIEDGKGNLVGAFTGTSLKNRYSPWVYGEHIVVRLKTDGKDTRNSGWGVNKVQWVPGELIVPDASSPGAPPAPPAPDGSGGGSEVVAGHQPSIFVMDVERWNGASPQPFAEGAEDGGMLLRITHDCEGRGGARCIDKSTAPDLAHMVCPITAEVTAYSDNARLSHFYWADECAQIWKAWRPTETAAWQVRRLVNLNGGQVGASKDFRKIFRRLDLVLSTCPGQRVYGLYFGTGNVQRPAAKDELMDPTVNNGRDIVGVIWDDGSLPAGLTEAGLLDATSRFDLTALDIYNQGRRGWFIGLHKHERMLRDPLVFDRVAYFKTYEPTGVAEECGGGSGIDRIYAVNACTAAPAVTAQAGAQRTVSEREVWNGQTEIGGGLFFFTPKDSPVLVSHADITRRQKASLNEKRRSRPTLFLWREE